MAQEDLIPADLSNRKIGIIQGYKEREDFKNKKEIRKQIRSLQDGATPTSDTPPIATPDSTIPDSNTSCNLDEIAKGTIIQYIPTPTTPTTPTTEHTILEEHLAQMNAILDRNNNILEKIESFLTTKSPTNSWFEVQTTSSVATPPNAVNPNQDPNNLTDGVIPGYDEVEVNKRLQGRNAQKLWLVNDGLVPTGGINGSDIFVITSTDGKSFSPEFRVAFGEVRIINDVYSFRFRCIVAGNFIRASEREIQPPYIQSIIVSGASVATTPNRPAFTANSNLAILTGVCLTGALAPSVPIPNGFSISVRANVNNGGTSRVYVANSIANTQAAGSRVTLAIGDSVRLFVTDANLIFIAGSTGGENVDWIVEQ